MPGVLALTVSLAVCITVSPGSWRTPTRLKLALRSTSQSGRLAGRVRAGGAARVGGRGRAPCSAGDCAFRPGSPRLPGCAEVEAAMATIPLVGQHSGRRAQLGSRLQRGGGRAALRPAGRWEAAGPRPEGLWGRRERGASWAWPDRMRTCVSVQPAGSS